MTSTESIIFYFSMPGPDAIRDEEFGFAIFSIEAGLSLETLFYMQGNNPTGSKIVSNAYSLSAGDIIERGGKRYLVDRFGFREITNEEFNAWKATPSRDRYFDFLTPLQSRI